MRKYFTMLAVATLAVACQKDNIDIPSTGNLSNAITISFSEKATRGSFNNNTLAWSWSANDEIKGYQNAGEKPLNTLSHESEDVFSCANFTYATDEPARFHFFYPATAEQEGTLVAEQKGVWNPILVGSTVATTLQNIGTVEMQHLTSALEIRASGAERITAVSLTSENDFVGTWSVNDDLTYTQGYSGSEITLSGLNNKQAVVINMPVLTEDELEAKAITLSVTTTSGTTTNMLADISFVAGQRTIINIRENTTKFYASTFKDKLKTILNANQDVIAIRFIANSSVTSSDNSYKIQTTAAGLSYTPIYFVVNGTTLEIHTAAREFMLLDTSMREFFNGGNNFQAMQRIQSLDLSNFNTSNIISMYQMFANCYKLTSLTLSSSFDTSKVTDMYSMFFNCYALTSLDLSSFKTSNVTDMSYMFKQCNALASLTFSSNFDTSKVTNMTQMFVNCYVLTSLDLSGFNFAKNPSYASIFNGLGKAFTDPQKTTVWVSDANASWFDGKTLGDGTSKYEIIKKSNPQ